MLWKKILWAIFFCKRMLSVTYDRGTIVLHFDHKTLFVDKITTGGWKKLDFINLKNSLLEKLSRIKFRAKNEFV